MMRIQFKQIYLQILSTLWSFYFRFAHKTTRKVLRKRPTLSHLSRNSLRLLLKITISFNLLFRQVVFLQDV
jgi:hypothetical protein